MSSLIDIEGQIFTNLNNLRYLINKLMIATSSVSTVVIKPNPPPIVNLTPNGLTPTPRPYGIMSCVLIAHIIDEKPGSELFNIVLSTNDFNILKQNDHVFTVIPVNPAIFQAIPTMGIHDLTKWIADNSVTKVPDVPADDV